jgi:hypothetical protein
MSCRRLAPLALAIVALAAGPAHLRAQSLEDGVMMNKNLLCTGFEYAHDSWDQYWEGTLKRGNGNIGTITTQSVMWGGDYGITDRLNALAMVPYVWTKASQGTLAGQSGFQDLTFGLKYNLLETEFTKKGFLRAIVVGSVSTPLSDYVPDLMPLTIGSASTHLTGRFTLMFQAKQGWFVHATGAYTWRDQVTLDRPAYFTDGQLFLSDKVNMSDVFDYSFSAGYNQGRLYVPFSFTQRITLGGGDIRRQDMPFISNRFNASRLDGTATYYLSKPKGLGVRFGADYVVSGRNVGEATTVRAGILYVFHF